MHGILRFSNPYSDKIVDDLNKRAEQRRSLERSKTVRLDRHKRSQTLPHPVPEGRERDVQVSVLTDLRTTTDDVNKGISLADMRTTEDGNRVVMMSEMRSTDDAFRTFQSIPKHDSHQKPRTSERSTFKTPPDGVRGKSLSRDEKQLVNMFSLRDDDLDQTER